jgi:hypothetical protein
LRARARAATLAPMQREAAEPERAAEPAAAPAGAAPALSPQARVLALQRSVGNRAVAQLIARSEHTKPWIGDAPALPSGDWYREDRDTNSGTWHDANEHNLRNGRSWEYPTAKLRSDFYRWFYIASTSKGHETRWPLAASIVAAGAGEIINMSSASEGILGSGINELQGMMREGNQVIFDNVFPKLAKLYDAPPVKGQAALDWDAMTLAEEQNLIQPLYGAASSDARKILEGIAKGDAATQAGALFSDADEVKAGTNIKAGDVPYFDKSGNLQDVAQRFAYGMKLAGTFSTITPSGTAATGPPTPDAGYFDGSALRRVDTRRNLHFLDAIIDTSVSPPEQEQMVKRMALFTDSEKRTFLRDYAGRLATAGVFPYRLLEGLAPWGFDLEAQLDFVDRFLKKKSFPWVDIKYSMVRPMITNSPKEQRQKIRGARWKKIFIDVCDDDDIGQAVDDLGMEGSERSAWISEEKSWL